MSTNKCEEVIQNRIELIVLIFKTGQTPDAERIVSCLYSCFKQEFVKWAVITYSNHSTEFITFTSDTSFTDGVLLFTEKAAAGNIYAGTASLRTILFSFYKNKLLENITKEKRLTEKKQALQYNYKYEATEVTDDEREATEKYHSVLEDALSKIDSADRQIIIWRHLEERSCDEIAALLGINVTSATNRIYRCMQRLRSLTENSIKTSWK